MHQTPLKHTLILKWNADAFRKRKRNSVLTLRSGDFRGVISKHGTKFNQFCPFNHQKELSPYIGTKTKKSKPGDRVDSPHERHRNAINSSKFATKRESRELIGVGSDRLPNHRDSKN
jgi:hypothetical protein